MKLVSGMKKSGNIAKKYKTNCAEDIKDEESGKKK